MNEQSLRGLLGLALRAGQMTTGADLTLRQIKAGKAALVLLDADASGNTKKKLLDACAYRQVSAYTLPAGMIDTSCGKDGRFAAALSSGNLAEKIRSDLES